MEGRAGRFHLKGVNSAKKKLAKGEVRVYNYVGGGGARTPAEPDTPDFIRLYTEACAKRKMPPPGTLFTLIAEFKASAEFQNKSKDTQRAYLSYLKLIEGEFGDFPIAPLPHPAPPAPSKPCPAR